MTGFAQQNQGWGGSDTHPRERAARDVLLRPDGHPVLLRVAQNFAISGPHYHASVLRPHVRKPDVLLVSHELRAHGERAAGSSRATTAALKAIFPPPPSTDGGTLTTEVGILDLLEERHVNWEIFHNALPSAAVVYGISIINLFGRQYPDARLSPDPRPRATRGTSSTRPRPGRSPRCRSSTGNTTHESDGQDEHPPADVQIGQKLVSALCTRSSSASPQWPTSRCSSRGTSTAASTIDYPPPSACIPDNTAPILNETTEDTMPAQFDRYGVRVPVLVVSPYAKKGYVGHTTYDHTSILRFIETKFKVPALTARDANADPMEDLFDFSTPQQLTPPVIAEPTIDPASLTYCETTYPHDAGGL